MEMEVEVQMGRELLHGPVVSSCVSRYIDAPPIYPAARPLALRRLKRCWEAAAGKAPPVLLPCSSPPPKNPAQRCIDSSSSIHIIHSSQNALPSTSGFHSRSGSTSLACNRASRYGLFPAAKCPTNSPHLSM